MLRVKKIKYVILCADDYAYNQTISAAILKLIVQGKISATSCMTNMPNWLKSGALLKPYHQQVDIGLHFNLTDGYPLTQATSLLSKDGQFNGLQPLIFKAYTKRLIKQEISNELLAQLKRFEAVTGFLPDFIDGHQHIQQLPIVRDALIAVYQTLNLQQADVYVRVSSNGLFSALKELPFAKPVIIYLLGSRRLRRQLEKANIPHNQSFSGIYDFSATADYSTCFNQFLKQIDEQAIIMCHPGETDGDCNDAISQARHNEYQFFLSDQFTQLLRDQDIKLARFK